MQQKITWLIFLILGISSFACKKSIDYAIRINYIFVNETKYNISFNKEATALNVKSQSKSDYSIITEGGKMSLTKENFPFPMQSLCSPCIVYYNDTRCDTLNGTGIENIKNFELIKIKEGEFQLKYTFNESDYVKAKYCK